MGNFCARHRAKNSTPREAETQSVLKFLTWQPCLPATLGFLTFERDFMNILIGLITLIKPTSSPWRNHRNLSLIKSSLNRINVCRISSKKHTVLGLIKGSVEWWTKKLIYIYFAHLMRHLRAVLQCQVRHLHTVWVLE